MSCEYRFGAPRALFTSPVLCLACALLISGCSDLKKAIGLERSTSRTVITTYGNDLATAATLFHRETTPGKVGRQMQTWMRTPDGWRVVAAHVSLIDAE